MSENQPKREEEPNGKEEIHYDSESIAGFIRGLVEDFESLRRKLGSLPQEERVELEADIAMINMHADHAIEQVETMESHATEDVLTGLLNRRGFKAKLNSDIEIVRGLERNEKHEDLHVLFIDLDNFKAVKDNPKLSHAEGDLYLQTVASFMQTRLQRGTDTLGRLGGDEFAAVLFGNDSAKAEKVANTLVEAVHEASAAAKEECRSKGIELTDEEANVSASVGLVTLRKDEQLSAILKRADAAMYTAKANGKGRVEVAR